MSTRFGILHARIIHHRVGVCTWETYLAMLQDIYPPSHLEAVSVTPEENPWNWRDVGDERNAFIAQNPLKWETCLYNDRHPIIYYTPDMFADMVF